MLNPIIQLDSQDVKLMLRKLKNIEPDLVKQFRGEVRAIARPVDQEIKRNIPDRPPMSGMGRVIRDSRTGNYYINEGRLSWQGNGVRGIESGGKIKNKSPKSTTISNAIKPSGRSMTTSIAKIILNNPAVSMADMAGRAGGNTSRGISREYVYRKRNGEIVRRRHRVTNQGQYMIRNLSGLASRYGWAALEDKIDTVAREIEKVLEKYYRIANRGL